VIVGAHQQKIKSLTHNFYLKREGNFHAVNLSLETAGKVLGKTPLLKASTLFETSINKPL
jgi:hypothetical protein